MNLGQTMITMGMFVLLIMSVISANRMLLQNSETNLENEALTECATIANDVFQEAESKKFDKFANESGTQDSSAFSPPNQGANEWGPSAIEAAAVPLPDNISSGQYRSRTEFDDVDDYNGYARIVNADSANGIRLDGFLVTVRVFYVALVGTTWVEVYHQSRDKAIVVTVKNEKYFPEYMKEKNLGVTITSYKSY